MPRKTAPGLPSREQILEFIQTSEVPAGKREIAKAFGLKGDEKIALKARLKDMADEGLIDGNRSAFHQMGGVPKVTVLTVAEIDDGTAVAVPENWDAEAGKPPRIYLVEARGKERKGGKGQAALKRGDRVLARTEQTERGWRGYPIKKLPARSEGLIGVVELDGAGKPWLAPVDKRVRQASPISDMGEAKAGELVLAERVGRSARGAVRVVEVVGDPLAPKSFSLIAIAQHGIPHLFSQDALDEAGRAADLPLNADRREDLRHLPIVAIDPADVCSLIEGEDRAAMVCHLAISPEGKLTGWRFTRALVRLAANIAYEDAQAAIDDGSASQELRHLWDCWHLLHKARVARDPLDLDLPERRVLLNEAGQIEEVAVRERLDAHRVVEDFMIAANVAAARALEAKTAPVVYRVHESPSREKLLALRDFLATSGRKLALGQVVTPSLFNRMLKDIGDEAERALVMEAVLRSQTQAYYGPRNAGHFGLALASYAHFTSPIRRYADLLVHRALVDAYGLEQPKPQVQLPATTGLSERDRASLQQVSDAISTAERRAMEAERDTIDRYVAAWLSERVGEVFPTRITGVQGFGFFATILQLGGDGLVPISTLGDEYFRHDEAAQALVGEESGTRFAVGDRLDLRLAEANPLTGALKFELPEGGSHQVEPRGGRPATRTPGGKRSASKREDGRHTQGRRGRPGNIRHQGRGKRR